MTRPISDSWDYKGGDVCADFFTACLKAAKPDVPVTATVLEIGCAEYDWIAPAERSWPSMTITGIDTRKATKASNRIQADVLTHTFEPESFDWIVSISAIEHIGLGHYGDPKDADGDIKAIRRAYQWLKPGGWLFFDVPWHAEGYQVVSTSHRLYDDAAMRARFWAQEPWRVIWTGAACARKPATLLPPPYETRGGDHFYYRGTWARKPA